MDKNADTNEVTTGKLEYHAPQLRQHGNLTETTGDAWDDPAGFECES